MTIVRRLSCIIVGLYLLVVGLVDEGQGGLSFLRREAGTVLTVTPVRGFEPAASRDIPGTEAEAAAKERPHLQPYPERVPAHIIPNVDIAGDARAATTAPDSMVTEDRNNKGGIRDPEPLYRLASHSGRFCGTATLCFGALTFCKDRYCDAAGCPISSHKYLCGACFFGFGDWVPPVAPPHFGGGCRDDP
jgi:hypothetical protein